MVKVDKNSLLEDKMEGKTEDRESLEDSPVKTIIKKEQKDETVKEETSGIRKRSVKLKVNNARFLYQHTNTSHP